MLYITKPGLLKVLRVGRFLYYVNFWDCSETTTTFLPLYRRACNISKSRHYRYNLVPCSNF